MKALKLLISLLMTLLMQSCIHRELDELANRGGYVEVVFDWRNAPDANPASMRLFLFPRNGGNPEIYDFSGRKGGIIRVAPGVYDAICINSDRRNVIYRQPDLFDEFEVTTPELKSMQFTTSLSFPASDLPVTPGTENQKIMMQPPVLWSSSEVGFDITVDGRSRSNPEVDHQVLYMYPKLIVDTYIVTVKNVRNAQYLHALSGTISDMSDGYLAGPQIRTDTSVLLSFNLAHNLGDANAEGMFLTFGHCPDARRSHKLILYAVLTDGSKYYYEFDVSDQAHNPPDENGIYHIIVEFIDIPEPSGDNIAPDVNNWSSVDIFLDM